MNVDLVAMDREQALEQLRPYRAALHRGVDAEYQEVALGLEALAEGTPLLSVQRAIRDGGFDELMRPRLAIARADRRQLRFTWESDSTRATFSTRTTWRGASSPSLSHEVDLERVHGRRDPELGGRWFRLEAYALVPMVPPEVAAKVHGRSSLARYHILWEVDHWSETPLGAQPPRDPYLLRRIGHDLWAVVAEWELTELERLVMAGRVRA
jgi:hypothetical protein